MTEHSHCGGYVYDPEASTLHKFVEDEVRWSTNVKRHDLSDLSVVDIECNDQIVAITTGRFLTILDAESGTLLREILHPSFSPGLEGFSRLTIAGGKVWANRMVDWASSKIRTDVVGYAYEGIDDPESQVIESCKTINSRSPLPFQKMPVENGELLVQHDGDENEDENGKFKIERIALDSGNTCEEVQILGGPEGCGWRCLRPVAN